MVVVALLARALWFSEAHDRSRLLLDELATPIPPTPRDSEVRSTVLLSRRIVMSGPSESAGRLEIARESVRAVLENRLGKIPPATESGLGAIEDLAILRDLLRDASTTGSFEEFERALRSSG